jgi:hypothetical protein
MALDSARANMLTMWCRVISEMHNSCPATTSLCSVIYSLDATSNICGDVQQWGYLSNFLCHAVHCDVPGILDVGCRISAIHNSCPAATYSSHDVVSYILNAEANCVSWKSKDAYPSGPTDYPSGPAWECLRTNMGTANIVAMQW